MSGDKNYIKDDKFGVRSRFKGAEYMELLTTHDLTVVGAGGIGSPHLLSLAKAGAGDIYLYEMDTVGGHNLGGQSYTIKDIGKEKAKAIKRHMAASADYNSCHEMGEFLAPSKDDPEGSDVSPIVHMCVDNNKVRKLAFNKWVKQAEENDWLYTIELNGETLTMPYVFFDGRLSFASYNVFFVSRFNHQIYRDNYLEISESPLVPECTTKSNVHVGQLTSGDMFQTYINHLQNMIDVNDGFKATYATPFNVKKFLHYNKTYTDAYGLDPVSEQVLRG